MNDKIIKDLHIFTSVADFYDEVRPGYVEEMYTAISRNKSFTCDSNIIEIGSGTGNSTDELMSHYNSNITAIEPCEGFYKKLKIRFEGNKKLNILNQTFEEVDDLINYDGIFSGTSFHWLDSKIKYSKSYEILKDDGLLIVYWNNYLIENLNIREKIKEIYDKYGMSLEMVNGTKKTIEQKIEKRKNEIDSSTLFQIVEHKEYERVIGYTANKFMKLIKTFADQPIVDTVKTETFFETIRKVISSFNGRLDIIVITNLEIAKKQKRAG